MGPGSAPADAGPTSSAPLLTRQIEPPPAPSVSTFTMGTPMRYRWCMFQPVSAGAGPFSTTDTSYEVPPMSTHRRLGQPLATPTWAEPITPPAGPEASTRTGDPAMYSLVITPPLACITS